MSDSNQKQISILAVSLLILVLTVGCATRTTQESAKSPYYEASFDDHNRAPSSFAPAQVTTGNGVIDPVYAKTQADYYFSVGESHSLDGDHQKAVDSFKMVLVYDPESSQVPLRLAVEYLKLGLLHQALTQAELAVQKNPKAVPAHMMLGGLYSSMKKFEKSLGEYQEVLKLDPDNMEAPLYIGAIFAEQKSYDKSVQYFSALAHNAENPSPYLAYYYIGRVRASQGGKKFNKEAEQAFNTALKMKPSHVESVLELGKLYKQMGQSNKAMEMYVQFQKDHGPSAHVAEVLAPIYLEEEKYDEALAQYEVLEASSDDNLNIQVKISLILIEQKKYQQAAKKLEDVLAQAPESDKIRFYLAAVYEEMKAPAKAIEHFKAVPHESEFFGESVIHATYLLKQQKKISEAEELAKSALTSRKDIPQLYAVYASLLDEKGDFKTAQSILTEGVKKFPDQAQLHFYLGTISDRLGDKQAVVESMKLVIQIDPNHVQGLNYLAYTYSEMNKDLEQAETLVKRALALEPKDAYVMDTYGWILYKKGETSASIRMLEAAYKNQPTESVILDHLGDAYRKGQFSDRAKSMYERAIQFETDEKKAQDIRSKITALQYNHKNRLPASASEKDP
jgi:tetratricopeptide (TPR) repeat protein